VEFSNANIGLRRILNKTSFTALQQCRIKKEEIKEMTCRIKRKEAAEIKEEVKKRYNVCRIGYI
jgi:hypothetical protein